jgi:transposase-like protein
LGIEVRPIIARNLQRPSDRWHLDEMVVRVRGRSRGYGRP